ncbi:3'(2'),5'-bisphosphate nucleotidase CysQ [Desulfovibrio inopinatus]|uniref:3'(2'),5'-bisphosphate nucleotidase CysQ n=1 Tax=Desulfovibrio inopinatus TaxID=102109 RepID=UPI000408DD77|nr:3'(2'),5'-bisphosphate nucleotidase CysQ [Desulfovibrio inopinatus]
MTAPHPFSFDIGSLLSVARHAGQEILRVYHTTFEVRLKADLTPLTKADESSNAIILAGLSDLTPDIPVLSEETQHAPYEERMEWETMWLVDPLDGTKEFVKKNGEFAVCIGLIENGRPVLGVIYVPIYDALYYGGAQLGAFVSTGGGPLVPIEAARHRPQGPLVALKSRSHPDERLIDFMKPYSPIQWVTAGSAYKFCLLASADAHVYPRLNKTYEWDTAAGHALLEGAGAIMTDLEGKPFLYNKPNLENGPFIAKAPIFPDVFP